MRQRIQVKRSNPASKGRLLSTLLTYIPGAWIDPRNDELVTLYRLRYRMAMEDEKYDTAMIFLHKILELDPANLDAKLCLADIYHRCIGDYDRAIEQYHKVIRLAGDGHEAIRNRAQVGMSELLEMLS